MNSFLKKKTNLNFMVRVGGLGLVKFFYKESKSKI